MIPINSLDDINHVVQKLVYASPTLELEYCITFEVGKEAWDNIQQDMDKLAMTTIPRIPYESNGAWMSFMFYGVKCFIKPK